MKFEPLRPEACGTCGECRKSANDPWRCRRPWGVGKLLGPLDIYYDPDTGLKRGKSFGTKTNTNFEKRSFGLNEGDTWDTVDEWGDHKLKYDKTVPYEKCAHSHPALEIQPGFTVYGGAASSPVVKDADIYVSLDGYNGGSIKAYPWNEGGPIIVNFPITDMQAPKDAIEFKKMVAWLKAQGLAGKKIHIGCIGGHGRTGTLLAALVKEVTGNEDAITYVRENYCKKAVESSEQMKFLAKEFGITEQKGAKDYSSKSGDKTFVYDSSKGYTVEKPLHRVGKFNERYKDLFKGKEITLPIDPVARKGNIWNRD